MAGKKKVEKEDDFDDFEADGDGSWEDDPVIDEAALTPAEIKARDWRDIERYKEERELRRLLDDDFLNEKPSRSK